MMFIDARLPIRFGPLETRASDEAVVTDGAAAAPPSAHFALGTVGHAAECGCCVPRSVAASALGGLFRERAVGGLLFRGVLAVVGAEGERAVREAVAVDTVVLARFRIAG